MKIAESELIINPNGSIFHLHLLPEQIADTILLVGDQGRVESVSKYFEKIEHKVQNREFCTHTGYFNGKRISVISTGIGTDNIDIVINELDALVNIDLKERTIKDTKKSLNLVRLGTSGALQEYIAVDSFVISDYGLGFDGLLNFYNTNNHPAFNHSLVKSFTEQVNWQSQLNTPYLVKGSDALISKLEKGMNKGITATACGFYGPQGRQLRLQPAVENLNEKLTAFEKDGLKITNFEMETSALYGLGSLLGHNTATVCAIIANRIKKEYSKDYKKTVDELIKITLERLCN